MEKRLIFPILMFTLAGVSFLFGGWQYLQARTAQTVSQQRTAFIITAIEKSQITKARKQELYTIIMERLPAAPPVLGIDFSSSFAGTGTGDSCTSDGQRAICRSLIAEDIEQNVITAVCGVCSPN